MSHRTLPAPTAARARVALLALSRLAPASLWLAVAAVAVVSGCSLGEGVTPECDDALPAGEPNACLGLAVCDDGRGGVLANESCCLDASRQLLQICVQDELSGDWRSSCQMGGQLAGAVCSVTTSEMNDKTPNVQVNNATEACAMASDVFDHCLAGGLLITGNTGGAGGAGTGGMATGGMSAGVGGAGTGGSTGGAGGG